MRGSTLRWLRSTRAVSSCLKLNKMRKVAIIGLGVVSAIGNDVQETWQALSAGKSGIRPLSRFGPDFSLPGGEVGLTDAQLKERLGLNAGVKTSRTALLGMMAAREAIHAAGRLDGRVGLVCGTFGGGMDLVEHFFEAFRDNHNAGDISEMAMQDAGAVTQSIAAYLGLSDAFQTTVSAGSASAGQALMTGFRMVRSGQLDTALVGGCDALTRFTLEGLRAMMVCDRQPCRPFDISRAGLNPGEGAGFLVLKGIEEGETVEEGVTFMHGCACVADCPSRTGMEVEDGPCRAMREALRVAGLVPGEIDYVNAHGSGAPGPDFSELRALERVFGDDVPPFASFKEYTGDTLGASEGIEAVFCILAMQHGMMIPALNFSHPMAECGLEPLTEPLYGRSLRHILSNCFSVGGNDVTLIFSR